MIFLWRVTYVVYRIFSRLRYGVTRRFTRAGLAVLGGLTVAGAMGLDTENTVAYQAFTLLWFLVFVAVAFSCRFKLRFSAVRSLPRFGTAGRPFTYRVAIRNLTAKTQKGLTLLENPADPRPPFREWLAVQRAEEKLARSFRVSRRQYGNPFRLATIKEADLPPLPAREEGETQVELTPLRRGVLQFRGLTLARTDPLGLFRAYRRTVLPQSVLILPKRYPLPPIALPGGLKYQEGGVALASNVGQSDEFVSLRDYRRGDPLRHIHWRSWAKTGQPIVKEFEDEFFVRHALVLDTFTDVPHSEVFEEAVSVAASFACTLVTQESLLDLLFVGTQAYCFTAGRGLAHADQMLEILASVRACADKTFEKLEHLVLNHVSTVSGCICVLLAWDNERREFVQRLKALGVPVLVLVIVPPGGGLSGEGGPMQDAPGRLHVLEVGQIKQGLAKLQ